MRTERVWFNKEWPIYIIGIRIPYTVASNSTFMWESWVLSESIFSLVRKVVICNILKDSHDKCGTAVCIEKDALFPPNGSLLFCHLPSKRHRVTSSNQRRQNQTGENKTKNQKIYLLPKFPAAFAIINYSN